jgi:hypothetical protein
MADLNTLLGTPPDQITEAEKIRRLQDICDREVALMNRKAATVEEINEIFQAKIALAREEQELDRKYPSVP